MDSILTKFENDSSYLNVIPVQIGNIWENQELGILRFNLPGINLDLTSEVSMAKYYSDTNYVWRGNILDQHSKITGNMTLIRKGAKKFGNIKFNDRHFIIRDLNTSENNDQVLFEINMNVLNNFYCGNEIEDLVPIDIEEPSIR